VPGAADRLFVGFQRALPAHLLGRLVYRLSRSQRPWLKNTLIRLFVRAYRVDTTEMDEREPCDYRSFNAFFTRSLKPGARTIDPDPGTICSPADGTVQQIGYLRAGQLLQVKGLEYGLVDLLGVSATALPVFEAGAFLTIYLAPHNYHRVHMPTDGSISRMIYAPGKRLAVNEATARTVPGLFAGNERLACDCTGQRDPFWLVFVGAMNVASISTEWAGEVLPYPMRAKGPQSLPVEPAAVLSKGEYCGHFNMGSTVVLVFPNDSVQWDPSLGPGAPLRVGQAVGSTTG
jgi:phosphatidylserine decarboxylase